MIRVTLAAVAAFAVGAPCRAQSALSLPGQVQPGQPLGAPGQYSFAPSGDASLTYGSHDTRAAAIDMQTGLLGDNSLHGFVSLGTASTSAFPQGPSGSKARITEQGGGIGVQKSFGDGFSVSLAGGWSHAALPGWRNQAVLPP